MNASGTAGRLHVGLMVVVLVAGCTSGASPTRAPAATPSVVVTSDVAYESTNPVLTPGALDVYAPATAGPTTAGSLSRWSSSPFHSPWGFTP